MKKIDDVELTYELIISKGKGKLTMRGEEILIDIAYKLIKKFNHTCQDNYNDCRQAGVLKILTSWQGFNELRYDSAFRYLTEVCKRGMAEEYNNLHYNNGRFKIDVVSLSEFKTLS